MHTSGLGLGDGAPVTVDSSIDAARTKEIVKRERNLMTGCTKVFGMNDTRVGRVCNKGR